MNIKKILIIIGTSLFGLLLVKFGLDFAISSYWQAHYSGPTYYTRITTKTLYKKEQAGRDRFYTYTVNAVNSQGKVKAITFNENLNRPLKEGAYLKMTVNTKKGVTDWRKIKSSDIDNHIKRIIKVNN
ncbi:YxeA family protein [Weissella muntiaci]|uniref:YxeA family protein n=1 Tax=Weissella muntiaci TaxID=2508881 RepID=A0A6C2CAJ0_9LACO|nr:YxeA family protein [Weissella muntiaci]TYC50997.1 YxeA family protein [Weissella muntiaci]